jgi:hypothetical protein
MLQQNSTQQQTNNPPTKMLQFWGGKKRETPTQKKTKIAIFLLHQSTKEGSNQNHKNKKKESRTPKHITLNNPQLEIEKPQAKKKK